MVVLTWLIKPWEHQRKAIDRAAPLGGFGLFFEMGAGKTSTAINILRAKYQQAARLMRTLVLGPPIVIQNWRREWEAHSKVGSEVICLEGKGTARASELVDLGNKAAILVTNYESLLMPQVFELLKRWQPEAIVFDESHKLKNLRASRTKKAIVLADMAQHKLLLSGTPILNSPLDIFSQFRVMDGGATFGKNFYVFRANYFRDRSAGMPTAKYFPDWVPKDGTLDELQRKIAPVSMTVKKADCLDLPPLVRKTIYVELSKEQRTLYDAMKKDFIAYIHDKACVATLAITKALRLQQIVSGFVALEGENGERRSEVKIKANPRADALRSLLSELAPHHKCIVWSVYKNNYETIRAICDELALPYVEVNGEVTAKGRQNAVDAFNLDPATRVFSGHPQSGGIGINLCAAPYSIFYSRTFSLENDAQAEARNYRSGSEIHERVTRVDIVATGTIDESITAALAAKVEIGAAILQELKI